MNWKDTVLKRERLNEINNAMPSEAKYGDVFEAIAKAQAEISFKAGQESVTDDYQSMELDHAYQGGKQAGMRKVVEWGEELCLDHWQEAGRVRHDCWRCWQAFLQENDIEVKP